MTDEFIPLGGQRPAPGRSVPPEPVAILPHTPPPAAIERREQLLSIALALTVKQYDQAEKLSKPGVFLTEEDELELRWIFGTIVINVTLGETNEVYVFDRATEKIVAESKLDITPKSE